MEVGLVEGVGVGEFEGMGYGVVVGDVRSAIGDGDGDGDGDGERDGDGDRVMVFRVLRDGRVRVEWWVLGVKGREVVGLMAEGVES